MQQDVERERFKTTRRDYTTGDVRRGTPPPQSQGPEPQQPRVRKQKKQHNFKKWFLRLVIFLVIFGLATSGWFYFKSVASNPVPKTLKKSLNFPVYYPAKTKLPTNYALDKTSFKSPQPGVLIYVIDYGNGRKIDISVQKKPSDSEVQVFYSNYIPLRNHLQTRLGTLEVGAYKNGNDLKTVGSLTTQDGTWIIATAPYDVDQNQLKQLFESLKH